MSERRRSSYYRIGAGVVAVLAIIAGARAVRELRGVDAAEGRRVPVCTAARDLTLGELAADDLCIVRHQRRSALAPEPLTAPHALSGRVVAVPALRGTVLTERHLAPRERRATDAVVPPGMRAILVHPADGHAPPGGSRVDVLASTSGPFDARTGATVVARRATVARRVDDPPPGNGPAVLLVVTPEQALRIAGTPGALTLAVLPPEEGRPPASST